MCRWSHVCAFQSDPGDILRQLLCALWNNWAVTCVISRVSINMVVGPGAKTAVQDKMGKAFWVQYKILPDFLIQWGRQFPSAWSIGSDWAAPPGPPLFFTAFLCMLLCFLPLSSLPRVHSSTLPLAWESTVCVGGILPSSAYCLYLTHGNWTLSFPSRQVSESKVV